MSDAYLSMEHAMESVDSEQTFTLFCNYCAKRDLPSKKNDDEDALGVFMHDRRMREYQNKLQILSHLSSFKDMNGISRLKELSESIFQLYLDFHYLNYAADAQTHKSDTNSYRFRITATIKLASIFDLYTTDEQQTIYSYLIEEYKKHNKVANIYENSADHTSLDELIMIFVLEQYHVDIEDVTNNLRSPFYMKDRAAMENVLYRNRYEDVHYTASEISTSIVSKAITYKPRASILINMDRSSSHVQEMISLLRDDWVKTSHDLKVPDIEIDIRTMQDLRDKAMSYKRNQKTLSGKLVDLLYVYDMKKFGFTNTFITNEISRYWNKRKPKNTKDFHMSTSTLHAYYQLTENIIDQKYYKYY
jgi:hypothetical protein